MLSPRVPSLVPVNQADLRARGRFEKRCQLRVPCLEVRDDPVEVVPELRGVCIPYSVHFLSDRVAP